MATEAQPAAPASQPSGQQLSTAASVEGGDIKVEVVPQLYKSVFFCSAPKVISNILFWLLSRTKAALLSFPLFIDPSFERSVGSGACATAPQQD